MARKVNIRVDVHDSDSFERAFSSFNELVNIEYNSSDNEGNRTNTKIDYKKKPSNTLRIVAIGGSTTMDGVTDDDKIWTNLLAKKLTSLTNKKIEVINTGVPGLRAIHHYVLAKKIKKCLGLF